MNTIEIIDKIRFNRKGVECKDASGKWVKAHYRQGDLDGACGVYSLTMALLILGYLSAEEVSIDNDSLDHRKTRDRFLSYFYEQQGFIRKGYSSICLRRDISILCPELLIKRHNPEDPDKTVERIYEYLSQDLPVIISTRFPNGGHFLVAIGAEIDSDDKITKILCLDPGSPLPKYAPWNCCITTGSVRGHYPFWCISEDISYKVIIDDLIVINYYA